MMIKISAITDTGLVRSINEDAVSFCSNLSNQNWDSDNDDLYIPNPLGALMIVADGMGGNNAGEIASSIAIETIKKCFVTNTVYGIDITDDSILAFMRNAIQLSSQAIINQALTDPDSIGLGTTIVLVWIIEKKAYIAWCGDSRCYCYNQHTGLKQLTKDHSYVQELIDKGEISPKQAMNHPQSNIITKCIGDVDVITEPDTIIFPIREGDILLACSDGLSGYCDNKSIERAMSINYKDISLCRDQLLKLAIETGGRDNISIALCGILPDEAQKTMTPLSTRTKRFINKLLPLWHND